MNAPGHLYNMVCLNMAYAALTWGPMTEAKVSLHSLPAYVPTRPARWVVAVVRCFLSPGGV